MSSAAPLELVSAEGDAQTRARALAVRASLLLTAVRFALACLVGLAPQETYYWEYSRHPALSYLDHPPMAAEWIRLGTALLGHRALGVRVVDVLAGGALTYLVYLVGERLFSPRVGLVALALVSATLLFALGGFVITPDAPLVLFWTATLLCTARLVLGEAPARALDWYVLGICAGLAMLSKYTAALLPPAILLSALTTQRGRRALRTPHPYLALLLSLGIFSPVIAWNAAHHFASFAFQTEGRIETVHGVQPVLVARFFGLQTLAVGPLALVGFFAAALVAVRRFREPRWAILAAFGALPLALFVAVCPFHWVKMNWPAPAYVALAVALAALLEGRVAWVRWTVASGALLTLAALLVMSVPALPVANKNDLITGWDRLAARVDRERRAMANPVVVGADYKTSSELAFHLPDQPRTASRELFGEDGLMYGFWDSPAQFVGRDLLVVSDWREGIRHAEAHLARACTQVVTLPVEDVLRGKGRVARFSLWRCLGYRGWIAGGTASAAQPTPRGGAVPE